MIDGDCCVNGKCCCNGDSCDPVPFSLTITIWFTFLLDSLIESTVNPLVLLLISSDVIGGGGDCDGALPVGVTGEYASKSDMLSDSFSDSDALSGSLSNIDTSEGAGDGDFAAAAAAGVTIDCVVDNDGLTIGFDGVLSDLLLVLLVFLSETDWLSDNVGDDMVFALDWGGCWQIIVFEIGVI